MSLKKILSVLLVLVMVLSMAACNGSAGQQATQDSAATGEKVAHSVTVKSAGGMALTGVEVFVYMANDLTDMRGFAKTDEEGKASVELPQGGDYAIVLESVPHGYDVADTYSFSGTTADITLTSALVEAQDMTGVKLGLGDVMYDFTVTTSDGSPVTLSNMLEEKEMVLINIWYEGCGPCSNEFPYMEEAYQLYQDKVGIIALNPLDGTAESISVYKSQRGLTFPMAACQPTWVDVFNVEYYPTSIVVDRYGVICLIETGALTSLTPFTSMFEHFTAENYEQKLCPGGVSDVIVVMKPTTTMPSHEEIAAVLGSTELPVTYLNAGETDLEYNWPFVIGEILGEKCIMTSNQEIESSYSIIRMQVELKAGQALGFDYIISSESGRDVFHVIVDGEPVNSISGYDEEPKWEKCYPCVATQDGTYEIALCYYKDDSDNVGGDAVYLKDVRIVDETKIDTPTYLQRQAAKTEDGFAYQYAEIVLNEKDGYYHVGNANGPLLLANLMATSQFNEENYIYALVSGGGLTVDGVDYASRLEQYANYAVNSNLSNYCTVTEELAELLKHVDTLYGFDGADTDEWLRCCVYYQAYGSDGEQMEDPVKGLAPFSAYTAKLGKNVATNYFYYNRIIMPRGMVAEFIPTKSGAYRITSYCDDTAVPTAFIFDENRQLLLTQEAPDERMYDYDSNEYGNTMVYYMEAGKPYYIDIAFWDPYTVGRIDYDIEYLGSSYQSFRICSPGYFTYDTDATGSAMYHTIAGGVKVVLGDDGLYYEDLGNGKKGSKIYCDFTGTTGVFSSPVVSVQAYDENGKKAYNEDGTPKMIQGMIEKGGFDFSKTEDDQYILSFMKQNDNDPDKTRAYLQELWGADYDSYAELYLVEDVLKGKYHGTGPDLTADIQAYVDKVITSGPKELQGCVVMDARLGEILQMFMDKFTFAGVDNSWTKMCYYYDYIGPDADR